MRGLRDRLTYANVVSTLCLFLVLSGGTAVALRGKNSVRSDDIKNGQVKRPDIRASAVDSAKVADGTITGDDIADGTLSIADFAGSAGSFGTAFVADEDTVPTTAGTPVDGAHPGPSVTLTVPPGGGTLNVAAEVEGRISTAGGGVCGNCGLVHLMSPTAGLAPSGRVLMRFQGTSFETLRQTPDAVGSPAGSPTLITVPGGTHTFTLQYRGVNGVDFTFRNRRLTLALG